MYKHNVSTHSQQPANSPIKTLTRVLTCERLNVNEALTPLQIFSPFSNTPWAMWLDSCNSNHVDSRYDIIVWSPDITLSTTGLTTTIINKHDNTIVKSEQDPLELVNLSLNSIFNSIDLPETYLPFKGGAVGYFAYDLGRRFENIPVECEADIDLPEMSIGIYSQAIVYDNVEKQFYLICKADERELLETLINNKISNDSVKELQKDKPLTSQHQISHNFSLTSDWCSNMSESEYKNKFKQVHNYLLSGDCYQINLAQRFTASYEGNEFEAYSLLRSKNNAPFSGFIRLENASILSLSPERFLQLKEQEVQSKPIKGTRPRHKTTKADSKAKTELLNSIKDKAENLMIVDLLRNDISKVCIPGSVKVPALFKIESFPAVHHLVSTVTGELAPQYSANDLLRGAFPGGSITGAPKIRAMEIIEELEPNRRSVYCGSIGYISACGNMDTSITIRTLICKNNKVHCWAGGGLVADSDANSEYQETFDKVNKILPVLKEHFYK